jgi:hypothetical protein
MLLDHADICSEGRSRRPDVTGGAGGEPTRPKDSRRPAGYGTRTGEGKRNEQDLRPEQDSLDGSELPSDQPASLNHREKRNLLKETSKKGEGGGRHRAQRNQKRSKCSFAGIQICQLTVQTASRRMSLCLKQRLGRRRHRIEAKVSLWLAYV